MSRIVWTIRAFVYSMFFGSFKFPGYIGKPIFLHNIRNVFIGRKVRIFPGLRIGTDKEGKIIIEDNVSIGNGLHITAGDSIVIMKGTVISSNVLITDINHEYREIDVPISEQKLLISKVKIGENCFIGAGAKILPGTILGKQTIVGANAVVSGIFPDYCVIVGIPARIVKQYDCETKEWRKNNG